MNMKLTYKFRLKDTVASELCRQSQAVNLVWNYCNDVQKQALKWRKKWPTGYDLQKLTTGSSKELGIHAHTIQKVCQQYWICREKHNKPYLKWRGKKSLGWVPFNTGHVTFKQGSFWFRGRQFNSWVSRNLKDGQTFGAGSFNQDSHGRWFINLAVEVECLDTKASNRIGVDLGLKNIANLSDGTKVVNPRWYVEAEKKLAVAQRANKKRRVRAIHRKIANQRKDFLHKASATLAANNGVIVVGNISSSKFSQTRIAKSVLDAGWSTFRNQLSYKSIRNGGKYVEVSEAFTTQTCSQCGSIEGPQGLNGLGIREWTCSCGATHDRDTNAATNILRRGLASLAEGALA